MIAGPTFSGRQVFTIIMKVFGAPVYSLPLSLKNIKHGKRSL